MIVAPPPVPDVPNDVDLWGVAADWSAAAIAFVALVVAIFVARATIQTNRAQQQTLDLQRMQFEAVENRAEREQAEHITFHIPGTDTTERVVEDGKPGTAFYGPNAIRFFNTSTGPVFDVVVYDEMPEPRYLAGLFYLIPTDSEPLKGFMRHDKNYPFTYCTMFFRDSARTAWVRHESGELEKATPDQERTAARLLREARDESARD